MLNKIAEARIFLIFLLDTNATNQSNKQANIDQIYPYFVR